MKTCTLGMDKRMEETLRRLVADFGREAARQELEWSKSKRDREWYEAVIWRAAQEKVRKAMRRAAERAALAEQQKEEGRDA